MRCEAWRGRNRELRKRCSLCGFHRAQAAGQVFGIRERCGKARPDGLICGDSAGPGGPQGGLHALGRTPYLSAPGNNSDDPVWLS